MNVFNYFRYHTRMLSLNFIMNIKIFIFVVLLVLAVEAKSRTRIGSRGVAKAGGYLGDSFASIINMFREKPQAIPKNYKRQYQRPVKEEHTLAYKFKNGLKNFLYLGYLILTIGAVFGGMKLYKWGLKTYYKHKISNTPSTNYRELRIYKKLLQELQAPRSPQQRARRPINSQNVLEQNLRDLGL